MLARDRAALAGLVGFAVAMMACGDPVKDDAVSALGPEESGVRPGPSHRPGQPCLLCHNQDSGPPTFSVAGTVYVDVMTSKPVGNVQVILIDSNHAVFTATTNCAGNFYVRPNEFNPLYPMWVTMRAGTVQRDMDSPVYREGSCAGCHTDPVGATSAGHVFLIDDPTVEIPPASGCN